MKTSEEITKDIFDMINEIIEIKKINGEPDCLTAEPDTYAYDFIIKNKLLKRF